MKQQDVQKAQRDEAEKSVALPQLRQRPPGAAGPSIAAAVPAVAQALLELGQNPVWRILRLTPHSGDDRCPLFSLDVQLADQSRAEKTRSKSLDLTNHLRLNQPLALALKHDELDRRGHLVEPAEEPDEKDDRDRYADQPKQKTSTHSFPPISLVPSLNGGAELKFQSLPRT